MFKIQNSIESLNIYIFNYCIYINELKVFASKAFILK